MARYDAIASDDSMRELKLALERVVTSKMQAITGLTSFSYSASATLDRRGAVTVRLNITVYDRYTEDRG